MAQQIISFDFYGNTYAVVFLDDGSAYQVAIVPPTFPSRQIAPPGTFPFNDDFRPAMVSTGIGNQIVVCIIAGANTGVANGYFVWDGLNLFQAGTASPVTNVIDGGTGYASAPAVTAFGGSGVGVSLSATLTGDSVSMVTVTAPGNSFESNDPTQILLAFTGGGAGNTAYGIGQTQDGVLTNITVISGGTGFTSIPTITINPVSGGSGATAVVSAISGGVITQVQVLNGGSGYNQGVTISTSGGGGTGATFFGVVQDGVITSVMMVSTGSGYASTPDIAYLTNSGSGAAGTPILHNGSITGVQFDYPSQGGAGYGTGPDAPLVQFNGGAGPASGTLTLMPFGVVGNAIEVYQGRIWIANLRTVMFTAPGSVVDFGNGGGAFESNDSNLTSFYTALKQSNGFLYLFGDSSVYYISGVTTSGTPPITTFQNLNVDPQIGTPWRESVVPFGRTLMFANAQGVYRLVGGAVEKVSGQLDPLFGGDLPNYMFVPGKLVPVVSGFQPSSCLVSWFGGQTAYALLIAIQDPFLKVAKFRLLMWDGRRWWTADQNAQLRYVKTFEQMSYFYAVGTDLFSLYLLFQSAASNTQQKVLISKQHIEPSIAMQKKSWGMYAMFAGDTQPVTLDFTVDSESGSHAVTQGTFTAAANQTLMARSSAPAPSGQAIGFTMTSMSPYFWIVDLLLVGEDYALKT